MLSFSGFLAFPAAISYILPEIGALSVGTSGREFLIVFTPNADDASFASVQYAPDGLLVTPTGAHDVRFRLSSLSNWTGDGQSPTVLDYVTSQRDPRYCDISYSGNARRIKPMDAWRATSGFKDTTFVSRKALMLIAEDDVVVQVTSANWRSGSSTTVFPLETLGKEYYLYVPARDDYYSTFSVISAADNNDVLVTLPPATTAGGMLGRNRWTGTDYQPSDYQSCTSAPVQMVFKGSTYRSGDSLKNTLQKSETWFFFSTEAIMNRTLPEWTADVFISGCFLATRNGSGFAVDLTGIRITSTYEVAVFVSATKGYSGSWGVTTDKMEEFLPPVEAWGKQYPFPRTPDRWTTPDTLAIVIKHDGSLLQIWNTSSISKEPEDLAMYSGQVLRRLSGFFHDSNKSNVNQRDWITSSMPIMVVAITSGADNQFFIRSPEDALTNTFSTEWAAGDPYDQAMVIAVSTGHFTNDATFSVLETASSDPTAYTHCLIIIKDMHRDGLLINEVSIQQWVKRGLNAQYTRHSYGRRPRRGSTYGSWVIRRLAEAYKLITGRVELFRRMVFRLRHSLPNVAFAAYTYGGTNQDGRYSIVGAKWWHHNALCIRQPTPPGFTVGDDLDNDCDGLVNEELCWGNYLGRDEDGDGVADEDCAALTAGLKCTKNSDCSSINYAWICNAQSAVCECDRGSYITEGTTGMCVRTDVPCNNDLDCNVTDYMAASRGGSSVVCRYDTVLLDNYCRCKKGYWPTSENRCERNLCSNVKCPRGTWCVTIDAGGRCVGSDLNALTRLNIYCFLGSECDRAGYALCRDGVCVCEDTFQSTENGQKCAYAPATVTCTTDVDCLLLKGGWTCSRGLKVNYCICREGFQLTAAGECILSPDYCYTTVCDADDQCRDQNQYCNAGFCCCKRGFQSDDKLGYCVEEDDSNVAVNCAFCNPCDPNIGCPTVPNSYCSPTKRKCVCNAGYYLVGNQTCKLDRYDMCSSNPCPERKYCFRSRYKTIYGNRYDCVSSFFGLQPRLIGKMCYEGCPSGARCLNKQCVCLRGYAQIGGRCTRTAIRNIQVEIEYDMFAYSVTYYGGIYRALVTCLVGEVDRASGMRCNSRKELSCQSGFTQVSTRRCFRLETCAYDKSSSGGRSCGPRMKCDEFGVCQCYTRAVRGSDNVCRWDNQTTCLDCGKNLSSCTDDSSCGGKNMFCNEAKMCSCQEGFILNHDNTGCVEDPNAVSLNRTCRSDADCSKVDGSYCNIYTGRCTCPPYNCMIYGDRCVDDEDDCRTARCPRGTVCVDRPCAGNYGCIVTHWAYLERTYDNIACVTNEDCLARRRYYGGRTTYCDNLRKVCTCAGDLIIPARRDSDTDFCIKRPGRCTKDQDCMGGWARNAYCENDFCQCRPETALGMNSRCIVIYPVAVRQPPYYGQCYVEDDCRVILPSLRCSNKTRTQLGICLCPDGLVLDADFKKCIIAPPGWTQVIPDPALQESDGETTPYLELEVSPGSLSDESLDDAGSKGIRAAAAGAAAFVAASMIVISLIINREHLGKVLIRLGAMPHRDGLDVPLGHLDVRKIPDVQVTEVPKLLANRNEEEIKKKEPEVKISGADESTSPSGSLSMKSSERRGSFQTIYSQPSGVASSGDDVKTSR